MSSDGTKMNCEQYREAIGSDPTFDGGAGHLSTCTECQRYRADMLALNARIERALTLTVPEIAIPDLPQADHENVVSLPLRRRMTTPAWFAVAATVAIAAFIGLRFGGPENYDALSEEVLAHVTHEPEALRITNVAVADQKLDKVVPATIAVMDHRAGLITFAETCPINGNDVPHLVIQGQRGPVTILLLPNEKISRAIQLNDENSHGVLLPVGDGSIAIVGSRDEDLEEIQKQVKQSVMWTT